MAIVLILILYAIISICSTGGDWFAWLIVGMFVILAIIIPQVTKEERNAKAEEFSRRFDEAIKEIERRENGR